MQKTRKQIIDETVEYYSADPEGRRAVLPDGIHTAIRLEDGRKDPIGLCLSDNTPDGVWDYRNGATSMQRVMRFQRWLKDGYRGHPTEFWRDLQNFHDKAETWDADGLTEQGQAHLASLRKRWEESS